jgi:3-phenylpropionate/cinnamic acid dioxygenase small subunit
MSPADDRHAITGLVFAYAERIDAGDLDGVADLLRDAVWRSKARPAGVRGRDAIRSLYADVILYDGSPCTQHVVTNLVIDMLNGDAATARSRFTVLQALPDFPLQPIAAGRYHDAFARDEHGWRFTERTVLLDLLGDVSRHLRRAPALDR